MHSLMGELNEVTCLIVTSGFSGILLCILILRFMEGLDESRVQLADSSRVVHENLMSGLEESEN